MRLICSALAAVLAAGAFAAPAFAQCDDGEMVIKFSHVTAAQGHPKGEAAALFAERVNEEMNGRACMEVYPSSQLYNDDKALEALLDGDLQFAAPSLSKFERFTRRFRVFDLPFMFTDIEAVDRFQSSEDGQGLMRSMRRRGVLGLSFWHNGMKQLSANRPLLDPSDAEGLKFRVQTSDVLQAQFEALGANPQKMAFSEVYGALQQGVVDGQENTWSNIYTKKFFEVQDGVTESNHGLLDYLVVTSSRWWDSLEEADRNDLSRILAEVSAERNQMSGEINAANRQRILDEGGEIRQLTPEQRAAWVAAMRPVWDQFEGDIGEDLIAAAMASNNALTPGCSPCGDCSCVANEAE